MLQQVLDALAAFKAENDSISQTNLAVDLVGAIATYCRLTPSSATLLLSLAKMGFTLRFGL